MSAGDGADLTPEPVLYSRGRDTYDAWPSQRSAESFEAFADAVAGRSVTSERAGLDLGAV